MVVNRIIITIIIIICIFIILYVFYYGLEINTYYANSDQYMKKTLEKDGICILFNKDYLIPPSHKTKIPINECLKRDVLRCLPKNYIFLDYEYKIKNVALSTFHRDVTSSKTNYNTKYPTYTVILYKYDGDLLSICPGSHSTYPFTFSNIVNINGEKGCAFLFDCDLLHAGQSNYCKFRDVVQYKLCHIHDFEKLRHLNNIRVDKEDRCTKSLYQEGLRKMSYFFQLPINSIFYPLMIKRENKDTIIGQLQNFIPLAYYNNI